tara:strand:+ start:236 stop:622 length:387 start_codon:yes stop_codon:yes gene_type:complete
MKLIAVLFITSIFNYNYATGTEVPRPYHDFFRKLIQKPKKIKRQRTKRAVIKQAPKKVIPKLQMTIHGISGEEGSRSAIVTFDREQLLLFEGDQDRNKKFKVIRIDENKITLLHTAAGKRQEITFDNK